VPDSGDSLSCSFCGKTQKQVKKLLAGIVGPRAFICNDCVSRAHAVIADPGLTAPTPIATIQMVNNAGAEQCSFCGKRRDQVPAIASTSDRRICGECLALCDQRLSEEHIAVR
jgi:ATP-dependent protease Clp ATPase subunit